MKGSTDKPASTAFLASNPNDRSESLIIHYIDEHEFCNLVPPLREEHQYRNWKYLVLDHLIWTENLGRYKMGEGLLDFVLCIISICNL